MASGLDFGGLMVFRQPDNAIMLCFDGKSQNQAPARTLQASAGKPRTQIIFSSTDANESDPALSQRYRIRAAQICRYGEHWNVASTQPARCRHRRGCCVQGSPIEGADLMVRRKVECQLPLHVGSHRDKARQPPRRRDDEGVPGINRRSLQWVDIRG